MSDARAAPDRGPELLALYDRSLSAVYGYLLRRCGDRALAEDLTAETFLAAVGALPGAPLSTAWVLGIARHKLVDHWRRREREERLLTAVAAVTAAPTPLEDPWEAEVDGLLAHQVLASLGPHHRAVLTLRYLDDLTVPQRAHALDRSLHATEALLVRARAAFRAAYEGSAGDVH